MLDRNFATHVPLVAQRDLARIDVVPLTNGASWPAIGRPWPLPTQVPLEPFLCALGGRLGQRHEARDAENDDVDDHRPAA